MPFPGFRRATAPRDARRRIRRCWLCEHAWTRAAGPADAGRFPRGRSRASAAFSKADFPRDDWWNALGDPQLDALIDEALRGTPTLAAADARLRSAIAQAGLADSLRKPSLAVGAQYAGLRIPETIGPGPLGGSYQGIVLLTMNFKYDPDFWGVQTREMAGGDRPGARRGSRSAGGAADARVEHRIDLRRACAGTCRTGCRRRRKGARLALAGAQPAARPGRPRQPVAAAPGRSRCRRCATSRREAAQQHIDAARNALAALLGKGPDRALSIAKPTLLTAPAPGVPSVLPSELLGHRPDVVAARWRVEAAGRGIDSSKAAFYPTVNLSALVGLASGGLTDLFGTGALLVQGGPAISLPIFDGGGLRNQLAKSDADYDLAVATYNESLVTALREVDGCIAGGTRAGCADRFDAQGPRCRIGRLATRAVPIPRRAGNTAGRTGRAATAAATRPAIGRAARPTPHRRDRSRSRARRRIESRRALLRFRPRHITLIKAATP